MARRFTQEQREEILDQVKKYRDEGLSQVEACKRAGIHVTNYYKWTNAKYKPQGAKRAYTKRRNLPVMENLVVPEGDILPPSPVSKTFLVIGSPSDVAKVLREAGL